jgi:hypothetical protein
VIINTLSAYAFASQVVLFIVIAICLSAPVFQPHQKEKLLVAVSFNCNCKIFELFINNNHQGNIQEFCLFSKIISLVVILLLFNLKLIEKSPVHIFNILL